MYYLLEKDSAPFQAFARPESELALLTKRLNLEHLPDLIVPSLAYAANGEVTNDILFGTHPIPDWTGQLNLSVVESQAPTKSLLYDYMAIPGPGGGPRLVVGNFNSGIRFNSFVFDQSFRGGVNIDADSSYIVLSAMKSGGPRVEVLSAKTFEVVSDFFASDPNSRNGITVALDSNDNIVVGGPSSVSIFTLKGTLLNSFPVDSNSNDSTKVTVVRGNVVTLSGTVLTTYSEQGVRTGTEGIIPKATSVGRGYYSSNLVATVTLITSDGDELEYDLNPLFPSPRLITELSLFMPPGLTLGNITQLDGVARYDLTFGQGSLDSKDSQAKFLDTLDTTEFPLGLPVSPTPGAYAIGNLAGGTGTLTGYVQSDSNNQIYALTNHHVVTDLSGNVSIGQVIYQPGPAFASPTPFGSVAAFTPNLTDSVNDSALITATTFDNRTAFTDFNAKVGFIQPHGTGVVSVGDLVYKSGFWGTKLGLVVATNQSISVAYDNGKVVNFTGQIIVASGENGLSWVIPGDSGSLVTSYDGTRVGQVFAGSSNIGVVSPINDVLSSLDVHFLN